MTAGIDIENMLLVLFVIILTLVVYGMLFVAYLFLLGPQRCTVCGILIRKKKAQIIEIEEKAYHHQVIIGLF